MARTSHIGGIESERVEDDLLLYGAAGTLLAVMEPVGDQRHRVTLYSRYSDEREGRTEIVFSFMRAYRMAFDHAQHPAF